MKSLYDANKIQRFPFQKHSENFICSGTRNICVCSVSFGLYLFGSKLDQSADNGKRMLARLLFDNYNLIGIVFLIVDFNECND